MRIPIVTTRLHFYKIALRILNPVLKLSNMEMDVLASIMLIYYANRGKDAKRVEKNLLSYKSRVAIRSRLDISEASLNNNISYLRKKGILVKTEDGFVLSEPIRLIDTKDNKFQITFNIGINE